MGRCGAGGDVSCYIGVDLGGTTIRAAVADHDGTPIAERCVPTHSHLGPDGVIDRIATIAQELVKECDAGKIVRLAVGVPGLVDLAAGITRFLPNLPTQWVDVPMVAQLGRRVQCDVRILNDVRTATLGELTFGHGRHNPHLTMVFFSIGTGVGGGVVIDGKLRLGPLGSAGEVGHQTVQPGGPRCGCGNQGCLETLASGPAIAAEGIRLMRSGLAPHLFELVDGNADKVDPQTMSDAAEGDPAVREVIERAGRAIGIAVANAVTILHPDLIVLGGGVAEIGEPLRNIVESEMRQRVGMFPTDNVSVKLSMLGAEAGVRGAIALAMLSPQSVH